MNSENETLSVQAPRSPVLRYKALVRFEIQRHREQVGPSFTQTALALKLGIEASYLSRCLNHSTYSPSRELLFRILRAVGTSICRIQELLELYDLSQAAHAEYRNFLEIRERVTATRRNVERLLEIEPRVKRIAISLEKISEAATEWRLGSEFRGE
jgi:transcriptional regulator with XRE-family HTH domain